MLLCSRSCPSLMQTMQQQCPQRLELVRASGHSRDLGCDKPEEAVQDVMVARNRLLIYLPLLRLDARPLCQHAEAPSAQTPRTAMPATQT